MKSYKKWIWPLLSACAITLSMSGCVVGPDDDHYRGGYYDDHGYGHGYEYNRGYEHRDWDHEHDHDWR